MEDDSNTHFIFTLKTKEEWICRSADISDENNVENLPPLEFGVTHTHVLVEVAIY